MRDFAGEIVVLNFWATWSNDSRELLDIINAIHRRYSKRYRFLAVAMDEGGAPVIKSFMREHPIACDVFVNGEEAAHSFGGIAKLPTTIVILRNGRILRRLDGLYRRKQYENLLDGIIRRRL
jgi:thiol-disulfide isomerase/thioredoxin